MPRSGLPTALSRTPLSSISPFRPSAKYDHLTFDELPRRDAALEWLIPGLCRSSNCGDQKKPQPRLRTVVNAPANIGVLCHARARHGMPLVAWWASNSASGRFGSVSSITMAHAYQRRGLRIRTTGDLRVEPGHGAAKGGPPLVRSDQFANRAHRHSISTQASDRAITWTSRSMTRTRQRAMMPMAHA
jgi:hypothetical protein